MNAPRAISLRRQACVAVSALVAIGFFSGARLALAADGATIAKQGGANAPPCSSCHGEKGEGIPADGYPRLAGLNQAYLLHQLDSFADGTRESDIMTMIGKALSPDERRAVAAYYSTQTAGKVPDEKPADEAAIASGQQLATRGEWSKGLPACGQCHGPSGQGVGRSFPALAGQGAAYLSEQLDEWKSGKRSNDPMGLMAGVANKLDDKQIAAVAAYYASLPVSASTSGAKQ